MNYLKVMKDVLLLESVALKVASERLDPRAVDKLTQIFECLRDLRGNLFFCGVGKSGIVANKMASTFSSLGLPSHFLHPVEAIHGDLGRIGKNDAIVFISKSGTTQEILKLMPYLPIAQEMTIGLLGNVSSPIAQKCSVVLDCSVEKEACINNQAPTTSSTLTMAMGDALAVIYEEMVGLSKEGFAINHPGGILGKSLHTKVRDLMIRQEDCPTVSLTSTLQDVILQMTKFPVGGCAVVDPKGKMLGILVEGDIRRTFTKENQGLLTPVQKIMNASPVSVHPDDLAHKALSLMEKRKNQISVLPVVDEKGTFAGIIRLHDLLKEGFLLSP